MWLRACWREMFILRIESCSLPGRACVWRWTTWKKDEGRRTITGVVKLFTPRHQNYPVFRTATVSAASGESTLQVSLISISRRREVHAQARKQGPGQQAGTVEVSKSS